MCKAEDLDHVVKPEELVGKSEAEVECMDGVSLTSPWNGLGVVLERKQMMVSHIQWDVPVKHCQNMSVTMA